MATLSTLINQSRRLEGDEADSYFKQIIRGVEYLHHCSVAHQDLRPENLVITMNGVLKIANFDNADYFGSSRRGHQKRRSMKRWSSSEYVAPEVFVEASFDPRPIEMWAVAVIYLEMRTGRLSWSLAAEGVDESYDRYLQERSGFWGFRPIQNLSDVSH
jgi:serine/threonine protein kinase